MVRISFGQGRGLQPGQNIGASVGVFTFFIGGVLSSLGQSYNTGNDAGGDLGFNIANSAFYRSEQRPCVC